VTSWHAFEGWPSAPEAWYDVIGSLVYPAEGHPDGSSYKPWFQVRGAFVFRVGTHPGGWSPEPVFRIEGDRVLAVSGPGEHDEPWGPAQSFRIVQGPLDGFPP
jgi:hypothetical protein